MNKKHHSYTTVIKNAKKRTIEIDSILHYSTHIALISTHNQYPPLGQSITLRIHRTGPF